jgi:endonuclease/exonuclease/phosphatase family metal-dependent hydrolase
MRRRGSGLLCLLLLFLAPSLSGQNRGAEAPRLSIQRVPGNTFRVLSWNVSGDDFTRQLPSSRTILRLLDPDILLLDEVKGGETPDSIEAAVRGLRGAGDTVWHTVIGAGGGRQRGVIMSRHPVAAVPMLAHVPYPQDDLAKLRSLVDDAVWTQLKPDLDAGIPVAAGIVTLPRRRVLAVALDLQSGAATPNWQEARRLIEVREIQKALQQVLRTIRVDAVLLAGDFNAVSTVVPVAHITNPYPEPHTAIVPAQALHLDGVETWTWDGRGTPFPTQALDFSFYSPDTLTVVNAVAFSTEDMTPEARAAADLQPGTSRLVSDHLPIIVDYRWRR